ncbi:MAG: 50S ribosomal protein L16 [Candidatus Undinarchaeales archaeon]
MPERGGGVYKKKKRRAYTRQSEKKPRKSYVKGVPGAKIHQFEAGDRKRKFELEFSLIAEKDVQIKHNALEAARVAANKKLVKSGIPYFLKIRVYPHHVLRENPLATGAGADRFQEGMTRAFGKPIGTAARVDKHQKIMSIRMDSGNERIAKDALRRARMKFPVSCRTVVDHLKKKNK